MASNTRTLRRLNACFNGRTRQGLQLSGSPHPASIRKHFPIACPDCSHGNLQRRFSLYSPPALLSIGEEFELDYKGKWTDSHGKPAPTFRNELYSFIAVDTNSKYIQTKLCQVIDHLESLRLFVASSNRTLRVIRTDNEFVTSSAIQWTRQDNTTFKTSIPFERGIVRLVECTYRTLQLMAVKILAFNHHLSSRYWRMAYELNAVLHNITYGNNNLSSYLIQHGTPFNFIKTPILPFGSIVAAYRSLVDQIALSGRSQDAMFVGIAPTYPYCITLFNLITKRTYIRHSFKYLSDIELISTSYVVTESTAADEEVIIGSISNSAKSNLQTIESLTVKILPLQINSPWMTRMICTIDYLYFVHLLTSILCIHTLGTRFIKCRPRSLINCMIL